MSHLTAELCLVKVMHNAMFLTLRMGDSIKLLNPTLLRALPPALACS